MSAATHLEMFMKQETQPDLSVLKSPDIPKAQALYEHAQEMWHKGQ